MARTRRRQLHRGERGVRNSVNRPVAVVNRDDRRLGQRAGCERPNQLAERDHVVVGFQELELRRERADVRCFCSWFSMPSCVSAAVKP